jgi:altronate dehydratase
VLTGFARADGRAGARNHLLVLPSVICATRIAGDIAERAGAVALLHQHGCSLVRDDAARNAQAFHEVACSPNVGAVLVVSLGCETVQGGEVAKEVARRGQRLEFIGIQRDGGSDAAVMAGEALALSLLEEIAAVPRAEVTGEHLVLGIEAGRDDPRIAELTARAGREGARVVRGDELRWALPGTGAQQHVALAGAGSQVIVSFPADDQVATGFPVCPVVAVAGASPLQRALAADFDLQADATGEEIWDAACAVFAGSPCAAELQGRAVFSLQRLAMTL